jgi:hypothetical protein
MLEAMVAELRQPTPNQKRRCLSSRISLSHLLSSRRSALSGTRKDLRSYYLSLIELRMDRLLAE